MGNNPCRLAADMGKYRLSSLIPPNGGGAGPMTRTGPNTVEYVAEYSRMEMVEEGGAIGVVPFYLPPFALPHPSQFGLQPGTLALSPSTSHSAPLCCRIFFPQFQNLDDFLISDGLFI